jgi:hypothetical protein
LVVGEALGFCLGGECTGFAGVVFGLIGDDGGAGRVCGFVVVEVFVAVDLGLGALHREIVVCNRADDGESAYDFVGVFG